MSKKPLPSISHPTLVVTLPVSKKKVKYRPFVIREQQALLLVKESDDVDSIYATIEDVLNTCTSGTLDLDTIPLCDLSYLFLQMHIASSGPEITIKAVCDDIACKNDILMRIDLSNVTVSDIVDTKIALTDEVGMVLRYPTYADTLVLANLKKDAVAAIFHLVEQIYDEESVYPKSEYTLDEFRAWFDTMSDKQLLAIYEFVDKIPNIIYDLEYHCPKCKKKHSKRLEGLQTFFRLSTESKLIGRLLQNQHDSDDGVQPNAE